MGADTRGSEAPDHVLISGTPTWSNGIGQLVTSKCAVCHQVPRLPSSPSNVPAYLDLRYEKTSGAIRAAEDIVAPISLGILHHTLNYGVSTNIPVQAMPLSYSTPLYADEISALESWAAGVIVAEQNNASPAPSGNLVADGELLFKRHCQGCHGMYGTGGLANRSLRGRGVNAGPAFATAILSTAYPMNGWPVLLQFANACTLTGTPTCNANQLDAIAAYLASLL
jgi:mono/diheme cytochrome c family protein